MLLSHLVPEHSARVRFSLGTTVDTPFFLSTHTRICSWALTGTLVSGVLSVSAVSGSSPVLTTTWICFSVAVGFKSSATLGIRNNVLFNLKYLFQLFARPH